MTDRERRTPREPREPISYPAGFARSEPDRRALVVLLHLSTVTPRRLGQLATTQGTARGCLAAVRRGTAASEADVRTARSLDPDRAAARVRECGARLVALGDPEYPPELMDLFDPPAGVFVRGRGLSDLEPRVSVVGARKGSPGGRDVAKEIGGGLAGAGACVVSGGARGIDAAAHEGALAAGGTSIAVLGCGIDLAYPRQHRDLLERISENGALVSEYPPGTPAEPFRFPARNRIVAALSRAVVVVEGALGSGSLITVEHALEIGREVFAVPGAVSSALAAIPLKLIREGATMIRGARDLIDDLGWGASSEAPGDGSGVGAAPAPIPPNLSANEESVWRALGAPLTPDQLAALIGAPLPSVLSALARLEIRGLLREVGGRYERRSLAPHP